MFSFALIFFRVKAAVGSGRSSEKLTGIRARGCTGSGSLFDFQPDGHRTPKAAVPGSFECGTQAALDAILGGLETHAAHPGLLHFLIHLTEEGEAHLLHIR